MQSSQQATKPKISLFSSDGPLGSLTLTTFICCGFLQMHKVALDSHITKRAFTLHHIWTFVDFFPPAKAMMEDFDCAASLEKLWVHHKETNM